jgi:hypothetical protein
MRREKIRRRFFMRSANVDDPLGDIRIAKRPKGIFQSLQARIVIDAHVAERRKGLRAEAVRE